MKNREPVMRNAHHGIQTTGYAGGSSVLLQRLNQRHAVASGDFGAIDPVR